jgi:hypothetical protein
MFARRLQLRLWLRKGQEGVKDDARRLSRRRDEFEVPPSRVATQDFYHRIHCSF